MRRFCQVGLELLYDLISSMDIAEGLLKGKVAEYPEPGIVSIQVLLAPFRNRISAGERARSSFA